MRENKAPHVWYSFAREVTQPPPPKTRVGPLGKSTKQAKITPTERTMNTKPGADYNARIADKVYAVGHLRSSSAANRVRPTREFGKGGFWPRRRIALARVYGRWSKLTQYSNNIHDFWREMCCSNRLPYLNEWKQPRSPHFDVGCEVKVSPAKPGVYSNAGSMYQ